jgi:quinol-cytochrome oxidoreductase complex cytochrome b subunit
MSLGESIRNSQVWKSVFRHPMPIDRRNRIVVMLTNFFLHLHPVSIKKQGIALSYTWCMGGVTFFLFLVETVTGVLLMFYYRPTLEWAYNDILALRDVTSLGILRELHRWGAHAMVITPLLGHEGPGQQLLTIGGIDMITNASDARFALLGARFVGEETLNRFYVLHCIAIPLAVSLLLAIHFWRVRKDGGISGPL